MNTTYIEFDTRQVSRIMPQTFKIIDTIFSPHIPIYRIGIVEDKLSDGRSPCTSPYDSYFPR